MISKDQFQGNDSGRDHACFVVIIPMSFKTGTIWHPFFENPNLDLTWPWMILHQWVVDGGGWRCFRFLAANLLPEVLPLNLLATPICPPKMGSFRFLFGILGIFRQIVTTPCSDIEASVFCSPYSSGVQGGNGRDKMVLMC